VAQRRPWEVEDSLWELIEPLLPKPERRFRHPGRRRLDDRRALCGILFVLYTGIPWEFLPPAGRTCGREKGGSRPGPARWTGPGRARSTT
jgi:transposase